MAAKKTDPYRSAPEPVVDEHDAPPEPEGPVKRYRVIHGRIMFSQDKFADVGEVVSLPIPDGERMIGEGLVKPAR
jgi:hypothetical protein